MHTNSTTEPTNKQKEKQMSVTGKLSLQETIDGFNRTVSRMEEMYDEAISEEAYIIASEEDSPNSYDFESRVNKIIDQLMEKVPFYCSK